MNGQPMAVVRPLTGSMPAPLSCVLWLDAEFGPRMRDVLAQHGVQVTLVKTAMECAEALQHTPDVFLGMGSGEVLAAYRVWMSVRQRALLIGQQDPDAFAEWKAQGVAVLPGPLPRPAVDWLARLQPAAMPWTPNPAQLAWNDPGGVALRPSAFARPRLVAVVSAAGGVGKTTTVSLLARLAAEKGLKVAVVEGDEDKSGILRLFGQSPATTGLDTIPPVLWEDPQALVADVERCAVHLPQRQGSITVYPMVGTAQGLKLPNLDVWPALLSHFLGTYELVLCDLPPRIRDVIVFGTLQMADRAVLVYEPTEVNLDSYIKHVQISRELELDTTAFRLLLNRTSDMGLAQESFTQCVEGVDLLGTVPEDAAAHRAYVNTGRLQFGPGSPWRTVYARLMGEPEPDTTAAPPTGASRHATAQAPKSPLWKRVLGLTV